MARTLDHLARFPTNVPFPPALLALAVVAVPLLVAPGCEESPPAPRATPAEAGLVLAPGDTLLDVLGALTVREHPRSSLPPAVGSRLVPLLRTDAWELPADAWWEGAPMAMADDLSSLVGTDEPLLRWRMRPAVRLDLALGSIWLEHEGRELTRVTDKAAMDQVASRRLVWLDPEGPWVLWWDPVGGILLAFGDEPPGAVRYGYRGANESGIARAEWRLAEDAGRPATASPLHCRQSLRDEDRSALLAPAPTTLEVRVEHLLAEALGVAVGVMNLGFTFEAGRVTREQGLSDGVTFAVEVVDASGAVDRVWSRHVLPGTGFETAEVDLSAHAPGPLTLRLSTEPGPDGDALGDYALWGDLRLRGRPRQRPERPHVIFIDIDTLRADRLGSYGYERPTSPRLDAWAARQAVVYTHATAAANWTLPSTASMLTGLSVTQHEVRRFPQRLGGHAISVAEVLRAAGWETWAKVDSGFVSPTFGFARGFDLYDFARVPRQRIERDGWRMELARLRRMRRSERPIFCFLHTYMVHGPYLDDRRFLDEPGYAGLFDEKELTQLRAIQDVRAGTRVADEADARFLNALYDAGVARMDVVVGEFLQGLAKVFGKDPYLVIITSDHGEEMFDHDSAGHGHQLHRELLDVPLLVRYPDGRTGRVERPVSSLDIVPTILDVVGLSVPDVLTGQPLTAEPPARRLRIAEHGRSAWAVQFDGYKLMHGEIEAFGSNEALGRLYDLRADPAEQVDIAASESERVRQLTDMLEEHRERFGPVGGSSVDGAVDDALIEELRALGYLGDDG